MDIQQIGQSIGVILENVDRLSKRLSSVPERLSKLLDALQVSLMSCKKLPTEACPMMASQDDFGAVIIEWSLGKRRRIGFSIEQDPKDDGWFLIDLDKPKSCQCGYLKNLNLTLMLDKFLEE